MVVDIDGVLALSHSEKEDAASTKKKGVLEHLGRGEHSTVGFTDSQSGLSRAWVADGGGVMPLRDRVGAAQW